MKYNENNIEEVLKEYNLTKDNYCLMVGRCVPENNYELVIKEYMNSKIHVKDTLAKISKRIDFNEKATQRERNNSIGGHRSGEE